MTSPRTTHPSPLSPPGVADVEKAYVFFARGYRAGTTPAASVEAHVMAIVERWNARIPSRRVRKLTDVRFREAADTLRVWTVAEILAAVDHYADQKWQKAHRAWKRFETWVGLDVVTEWCEAALTAAEYADSGGPPVDDRVATLVRETAAAATVRGENELLLARFAAYGPDEQQELLEQAVAEVRSFRASRRLKLWPALECFPARMQVLVILKRQQTTQKGNASWTAEKRTPPPSGPPARSCPADPAAPATGR